MNELVATLYRQESRPVFSTLACLPGSFGAAEDALHDAFIAASEQWPRQGVPANPVAWLVSTGRFKAVDRLRRDRRQVALDEVAEHVEGRADDAPGWEQRLDERDASCAPRPRSLPPAYRTRCLDPRSGQPRSTR